MLLLLFCGLVSLLACSVLKYIANVCDYSSSLLAIHSPQNPKITHYNPSLIAYATVLNDLTAST